MKKKISKKTKKTLFIVGMVFSVLLGIFGMFHIPILSSLGVEFPERNLLWGLSIIPTVVLFNLPFAILFSLYMDWRKKRKKDTQEKDKK